MPITFSCRRCTAQLSVAEHHGGRVVACAKCGTLNHVPKQPLASKPETIESAASTEKRGSEPAAKSNGVPPPLPIRFRCPTCQTTYTVESKHAGKKSPCARCGQRIQVPRPLRQSKTVLGELFEGDQERPTGEKSVTNSPSKIRQPQLYDASSAVLFTCPECKQAGERIDGKTIGDPHCLCLNPDCRSMFYIRHGQAVKEVDPKREREFQERRARLSCPPPDVCPRGCGPTIEFVAISPSAQVARWRCSFCGRKIKSRAKGSTVQETDRSRTIPKAVQREVWRRDEGCCSNIVNGVRCRSRMHLEYDHIIPWSKGGANTVRNIQLLCEKCNREKQDKIGE